MTPLQQAPQKIRKKKTNIRHNMVHKASSIIADRYTVVAEKLPIKSMTKSARGTKDNPGHNVKQKSSLNRSIIQ